jgi:hypothetical protein
MRRKDLMALIATSVVTAVFSLIFATMIFGASKNRSTKIPTVQPINTNFPDIKNDPAYKNIFSSSALDPTQPVTIGNSQNSTPFNGSGQ